MRSEQAVVFITLTIGTPLRVRGMNGNSLESHPTTGSAGKSSSMVKLSSFSRSFGLVIFRATRSPDFETNSTVSYSARSDMNKKYAVANVACPQSGTCKFCEQQMIHICRLKSNFQN
jgi:hypothetical protein